MAGIPGSGGPVPKRSDQRMGHRKADPKGTQRAQAGAAVSWPAVDPEWHPVASAWFESLGRSGQAQFYEASDVATAVYVATAMSKNLTDGKFSAMLFASVMSAMSSLLVTEGDRRRLRLELERVKVADPDGESASATVTDLRSRLGG